MKLQYFGHSFWKISTDKCSVVIDPFDNIGYPMPVDLTADYVIISHEHHDHNNVALIKGNPTVIRTPGCHQTPFFTAELLPVFHDQNKGAKRGTNNIIKLSLDGLTLVHCGDLGHLPNQEILQKINQPGLLLIPVGEIYTLPLSDAWQMIDAIQPRLLFPMHYNTPAVGFKLGELDKFTVNAGHVIHPGTNILEITPDLLSAPCTIIMNWTSKD
jgi:L-ascorbate metabolism protein UlaG (beta-lactamase superfamily)